MQTVNQTNRTPRTGATNTGTTAMTAVDPVNTATTLVTPRSELLRRFTTLTEGEQNVASQFMTLLLNGSTRAVNIATLMLAGFFLSFIGMNNVTDFKGLIKTTMRTMITKLVTTRRLTVNMGRINAWIDNFVDNSTNDFSTTPGTTVVPLTSCWRNELLPTTNQYAAVRSFMIAGCLAAINNNGATVTDNNRDEYGMTLAEGFNESTLVGQIATTGTRNVVLGEHRTLTPTTGRG